MRWNASSMRIALLLVGRVASSELGPRRAVPGSLDVSPAEAVPGVARRASRSAAKVSKSLNQAEEPDPDDFMATPVDDNEPDAGSSAALPPQPPPAPPKPLPPPCQYLVPSPKQISPERSPQAVHTALLPHIRGKDVVEFGARAGDALACFAQVARSSAAVESVPETCRVLEARAVELMATAGVNFSVVRHVVPHLRLQCPAPHPAPSCIGLPRL